MQKRHGNNLLLFVHPLCDAQGHMTSSIQVNMAHFRPRRRRNIFFFLQVIKDKKYKNHSWQQTNANGTRIYSKSQLKQISEVFTQENKHAKQTGTVYFISFINHLNISKQGEEKLAWRWTIGGKTARVMFFLFSFSSSPSSSYTWWVARSLHSLSAAFFTPAAYKLSDGSALKTFHLRRCIEEQIPDELEGVYKAGSLDKSCYWLKRFASGKKEKWKNPR